MNKSKIQKFVNHILDQNDWIPDYLGQHSNKVISLVLGDQWIEVFLEINEDGALKVSEFHENKKINLTIKIQVESIVEILSSQDPRKVEISGDVKLAKDLSRVLKNIKWDISLELEKYIGPTNASFFKKFSGKFLQSLKLLINNLIENLVEYYQEENMILAKEFQVKKFNQDIDDLSIKFEKIKKKMKDLN
jgi:ubiquinone biosynthesis protein UbiJ